MPERVVSKRRPSRPAIVVVEPHLALKNEIHRQLVRIFPAVRVKTVANGKAAVAVCRQIRPAVIVMDVILPGRGGIKAVEQLRALRPETPIVVFSIHEETPFRQRAREAGATAYIAKTSPFADIIAALRSVLPRNP